jgi:hypothetical protein
MRKPGVALLLLALGGLGAVAGWKWTREPPGDSATVGLSLTCIPGQTRIYALSYESRGQLSVPAFGALAGASPEGQSVETVLSARWRERCVRSDARRHVLEVLLEDVSGHFSSRLGGVDGRDSHPVQELLGDTSYVVVGAEGDVQAIYFGSRMPPLGQNILRDMLSLRSIRLREHAREGEHWTTREEDTNGPYSALYTFTRSGPEVAHISKRRQEYASTAPAPSLRRAQPLARVLPGSESTVELDLRAHQPRTLHSRVELELSEGSQTFGQTLSHLKLASVTDAASPATDVQALQQAFTARQARNEPPGDLAARDVDARIEARIQQEELGSENWESLLAQAGQDSPDRAKLFLKFKALFLMHPEACRSASELLALAPSPDETTFQLVAGALVSAGTPEAQHALVAALSASEDRFGHQRTLTPLLGLVTRPTLDTESALRAILQHHPEGEIRDTARLALGNLAHTLRGSEPERAQRLIKEGVAFARSAGSLEEQVTAIQALGNMGAVEGLELIALAVEHPNAVVRQSGAAALRFLEGETAESLMLELATQDAAENVRGEAVASLGFRQLSATSVSELQRRVRQDPSETVRQLLVKVLADEAPRHAALKATLMEVSQEDASPAVRKLASLVLLRLN